MSDVLRYAAFADDPSGGNPAGVVLDARGLDDAAMQAIAAEVGEELGVTAEAARRLVKRAVSAVRDQAGDVTSAFDAA